MKENDMLPSGANDELPTSGVNDEDEEEWFDDDAEDWEEDDGSEDEDNHDQWKNPKEDKYQRMHKTVTSQNRTIANLQKEMQSLKNSKNLSEEEIAKIKEKYSEEDLEVIEKIIENKTSKMLDQRKSTSLAERELNIFLKEYPELSDPELRHIQALQKDYGYSLKKAYTVLFGKNTGSDENKQRPKHSVNNFWWQNNGGNSKQDKLAKEEDKAYADLDHYLGK